MAVVMIFAFLPMVNGQAYAAEQHKVTFELYGGTMSESTVQFVNDGECAVQPSKPQYGNLSFWGWYTNPERTEKFDFSTPITNDITLYACFAGNLYAVVWDMTNEVNDNGYISDVQGHSFSTYYSVVYKLGDSISVKIHPFSLYRFVEWRYGDITGPVIGTDEICNYTPTAEDHLNKIYGIIVKEPTYIISFDAGEGAGTMDPIEIVQGDSFELPANAFIPPADKVFDKWSAGAPGEEITPTSDMTVTALWKEKTPDVNTYLVTFETLGGGYADPIVETITEGDCATQPEITPYGDFTFVQWYADPDFSEAYDFSTPVVEDITLYAKWQGHIFGTAYDLTNEEECSGGYITEDNRGSVELEFVFALTQSITMTARSDNGYHFVEWRYGSSTGTVVSTDATYTFKPGLSDYGEHIYAIFENDGPCHVTFDPGEGSGSMPPIDVDKGASLELPECGFTAPAGTAFSHWQIGSSNYAPGSTCVINEDTVIKAIWIKTGWQKIDGNWYYYKADGNLATGWHKVGGKWYYMDESGIMQTGWKKIGSKWYYFNASGVMQTGWQKISGKWYFFKSSGAMASKEWVKGYYWINKDGTWTYEYKASWKKSGSKWWFGDTSGWYAKNTTITIADKKYTFDAKGWLVE